MIAGIGVDIVEVARVERALARFGDRFAAKILSAVELGTFSQRQDKPHFLAKRFAAKEATAKALGTGMRRGIHFHNIVIERKRSGAPSVLLSGPSEARAKKMGATRIHLTLSDEPGHAIAFVVIESSDNPTLNRPI